MSEESFEEDRTEGRISDTGATRGVGSGRETAETPAAGIIERILERVSESAGVESVYGDPVEKGGRTVIPVARVAYGFGGGSGTSEEDGSSGTGGGGGVSSRAVGVVEIDEHETRFVPFGGRRRRFAVGGVLVGLAVGYLLGRAGGEE